MSVSFHNIQVGGLYSRPELARIWGYSGYQALARGVVTPRYDNKIILFVTEEKQDFQEQYQDRLESNRLEWEGPTDHFAEERIITASHAGEEIHIFHRKRHHSNFTYLGMARMIGNNLNLNRPSTFIFSLE